MKLEKGSKLVMLGDSITDSSRIRPVGEGFVDAHGKGYVSHIDGLLGAVYPQYAIRVVNQGIAGNTVRDLKARWQTDVLDLKPDWVSIMIGVNDVWRQFDMPLQTEVHVHIEEYEATLEELVTRTLPVVKGMILMTPFYIEPNRQDAMRARVDRYSDVVRKLAHRHNTLLADTQAAFDEALQSHYPAVLGRDGRDRVHPSHIGLMIITRTFLKSIGFVW